MEKKRVRPLKKPDYDSETIMRELLEAVTNIYKTTHEIKSTAIELYLPPNKVKKLLITANIISYPETTQIQKLLESGRTLDEVQGITGLSRSAINTYLPYSKVIYKMKEISQNAERVKRYKERKRAVEELAVVMAASVDDLSCTEAALWSCIIAFQHYPFHTSSGLPFTCTLKTGRNGEYTKELFIDRRENSKSLAWSSVRLAFEKAVEKMGTVFDRPKAIVDVRGISYVYPLLWRFGVIQVPGEVEERIR